MTGPEIAVADYLLREHRELLDVVRRSAEEVASAATDANGRTETTAVRRGTEAMLRRAGVWEELPDVLAGCVAAMGESLRASPVAAPPYVAATATGIVLRATLDAGRLVVSVNPLSVEREGSEHGSGVRLVSRDVPLDALVDVELR